MDVEKLHKINALVAEKVMGWKLDKMGGFYLWVDEKGNAVERLSTWRPTTCMSDVWHAVEKLRERFRFCIADEQNENNEKIYHVSFQTEHPITTLLHTYEAYSRFAPLSICLAALKAVGVDMEVLRK